MSCNSNLSGENHVLSNFCRSSQSDLGTQQRVFSNARSVTDLNQIVNLRARRNMSLTDAGAIDAGISLDLDIIVQHRWTRLHNLVPLPRITLGEAKAVSAYDCPILKQD